MRIVTYHLRNINIINKIEKFIKNEHLKCLDVNELSVNDLDKLLILFTDINDDEFLYKFRDKYICCIGFTPSFNLFYVKLEKDFNIIQFRAIIDSALKGGLLKFYINEIIPKTLHVKYEITNRIFEVDEIVFSITKDFIYFFNINELQQIRVGLCEMITNAIEHGNLEITGDEKFQYTTNGNYIELLKSKLNNPKSYNRKVIIEIKINNNNLKIIIEDEGPGFDTKIIKKYCKCIDATKLHGRGIMIAKLYFDKVYYNKKGNKVTLVKQITTLDQT
jgi:anti-sigma regulatory factor (Ser/Thr protein kinase)